MIAARVLAVLLGGAVVAGTLRSAVQTFVLPRSIRDRLSRVVFILVRLAFLLPMKLARRYATRDRILAYYAPVSLLSFVPVWYFLVALGYALLYWGLGVTPLQEAIYLSGSSLLTLGFVQPEGALVTGLAFTESALGLLLVALLIAYLPSMYSAFQRREMAVSLLEVRAGNPPSALELFLRYHRIQGLQNLGELWPIWENWFADVDESHTSLPALVFFRSHNADHSWVTAAGAVLDSASLSLAALEIPPNPQAQLCIRGGFLALRHIADFYDIWYNPDPHFPADPISITRAEFDAVLDELAGQGLPLKPDRDQAWQDFGGWRVNYDRALLGLCTLTMAPSAPWSSDRAKHAYLPHLFIPVRWAADKNRTQPDAASATVFHETGE